MTSLLAISFFWGLVYIIYGLGHWVTSHRMYIFILGRQGVEQHKSYGQFSLCLWHIYWKGGGGGPAGEHGDPTLFLGRTEHMGLRTSPPSLRVWMIGPPMFISFHTSTHWASLSSVGGWICNLADRHCCIITLMDGHPLTAFDAMAITKNY